MSSTVCALTSHLPALRPAVRLTYSQAMRHRNLPRLLITRAQTNGGQRPTKQPEGGKGENKMEKTGGQQQQGAVAHQPQRRRRGLMMSPFMSEMDIGRPGMGRMSRMMREMEEEMNNMMRMFGGEDVLSMVPTATEPTAQGQPLSALAVDVKETDSEFVLTADVPGMHKDNIKVQVSPDRVMTISGERKHEHEGEEEGIKRIERSYGRFIRRMQLPDNVDVEHIKAKTKNGVLSLTLPKTVAEEPKHLEVKVDTEE